MTEQVLGPDEVVVGRKIRPRRQRTSVLAIALMLAFVATCVVVFLGDKLGLRDPYPIESDEPQTVAPSVQ